MSSKPPSTESSQLHLFDLLRIVQVRWPIILIIFLLVVLTTAVITFLLPKKYSASALIEVQENSDFQIFQNRGGQNFTDPRFTSTQFEIIKSQQILDPVIEELGLAEKWMSEYELRSSELVQRKLQSMITLREVRNTDLIEITALSPDEEEAAAIANTIADEYQRARIREQQSWVSRSLDILKEEVEKQRKKTDELGKIASTLRVEFGINDLNPESSEGEMQASERVLLSVEQDVSSQRLQTASLRAQSIVSCRRCRTMKSCGAWRR